ncbi:cysteine-rich receptor-like protein kinase 44 isoform X2 [Miscanthus floridulus]|uniref:cysteine-rich receptor-like protein kinase 44 isoform X2 n=1 Tax=Miscanthus floridulus TaxID=154761 RepID=UPI00345AA8E6
MSESTYFKLDLIKTITGDFADERMVGSGGFGVVYRGTYDGQDIAVKKLHPLPGLDDKAFDNEFRSFSKINHPNVVRLIGYCHEAHRKFLPHKGEVIAATLMERVLCFEYMEGGSLDKHILADSCDLDWLTCYKIIKGTCEGLNRLHSEQGKPIYHMDLKPANILLDKNMTAKIGDLGLSRLVSSTQTYQTKAREGSVGYMPPEYINSGDISRKFDVFSLGVIIIRIMDGNDGNSRRFDMPREQFIEFVANNWKERLQGTLGYSSQEINMLRVKTCIDIALRCVDTDRNKRPYIKDIVNELEELEAKIQKMALSSDHSKAVIPGQQSSDSNILAVDPTLELRFLFELRKDISCCLQLTNKTDDYIAFNIKTNRTKYYAEPNIGIMPPCSKRYISVTLRAQEAAPTNMQCHDMLLVQSVNVSEGLPSDNVTEDFFKQVMVEKVVDAVKLPIVYITRDHFSC